MRRNVKRLVSRTLKSQPAKLHRPQLPVSLCSKVAPMAAQQQACQTRRCAWGCVVMVTSVVLSLVSCVPTHQLMLHNGRQLSCVCTVYYIVAISAPIDYCPCLHACAHLHSQVSIMHPCTIWLYVPTCGPPSC